MKIVFLETTDSDSASHHSYNREEKGKTLFFQKQFFVTRFISTLLIYNSIIQSKARLMFINVFFFCFMQTFFTYYVSTMKETWMWLSVKCSDMYWMTGKWQNILIWRNFFPILNDQMAFIEMTDDTSNDLTNLWNWICILIKIANSLFEQSETYW